MYRVHMDESEWDRSQTVLLQFPLVVNCTFWFSTNQFLEVTVKEVLDSVTLCRIQQNRKIVLPHFVTKQWWIQCRAPHTPRPSPSSTLLPLPSHAAML